MSDEWPLWWRVLHRLIRWIPVEPIDEINEHEPAIVSWHAVPGATIYRLYRDHDEVCRVDADGVEQPIEIDREPW